MGGAGLDDVGHGAKYINMRYKPHVQITCYLDHASGINYMTSHAELFPAPSQPILAHCEWNNLEI